MKNQLRNGKLGFLVPWKQNNLSADNTNYWNNEANFCYKTNLELSCNFKNKTLRNGYFCSRTKHLICKITDAFFVQILEDFYKIFKIIGTRCFSTPHPQYGSPNFRRKIIHRKIIRRKYYSNYFSPNISHIKILTSKPIQLVFQLFKRTWSLLSIRMCWSRKS